MIQIEPMPDELAAGHQGRIRWVNGCRNEGELRGLIKGHIVERGGNPYGLSRLDQLSLISGMDSIDYVRKHSMIGSIRVVVKAEDDGINDVYGGGGDSKRPGMFLTRNATGYCCFECIAGDVQRFGFSWYRRSHHLAGVNWCLVHDSWLATVDHPSPFACVPHMLLHENRLRPPKVATKKVPTEGFVRRFAEIYSWLLKRGRPFLYTCLCDELKRQAFKIGLRPTKSGHRPVISDHLAAQAGRAWLREHVRNWHRKRPFQFFDSIDAVIGQTRGTPVTGAAYAMAMAALYETSTDAVLHIGMAEALFKSRTRGVNWLRATGRKFGDCQILIEPIVKRLDLWEPAVSAALRRIGLPNMYEREPSAAWAALIRFLFGERISAACIAEQVERHDLRALLRKCSGNVMSTIKIMKRENFRQANLRRDLLSMPEHM